MIRLIMVALLIACTCNPTSAQLPVVSSGTIYRVEKFASRFVDARIIEMFGRDNSRTPMQWNDKEQAGFTSAKPWLAVNENYKILNVEEQERNPYSVLNYFRSLTQLRKKHLILVYGAFELVDENNDQLFAYTKQLDHQKLLIVLNFSDKKAILNSAIDVTKRKVLIGNYEQASDSDLFQPFEAVIYQIEQYLLA